MLSPYVVDTARDRGYQAANTLSGTRLNSRKVTPALWRGSRTFHVNVYNLFDRRGIIPKYLSANPPYEVPGGRGIACNRFDVIAPRTFRFTTTYEF